jgi:hypothetical protein
MLARKVETAILVSTMAIFLTADCGTLCCRGNEQPPDARKVRPITNADSVMAVYRENLGDASDATPALIFAAWPDGYVVWSKDRVQGGAPYQVGKADPKKIAALLARFGTDGLFADNKLNQAHFGPDSAFITVLIKSGKSQVKMRSWHELFEASDKLVVTSHGAESLDGHAIYLKVAGPAAAPSAGTTATYLGRLPSTPVGRIFASLMAKRVAQTGSRSAVQIHPGKHVGGGLP